jgi:crossover junction endodeoxyribonuclease RusA
MKEVILPWPPSQLMPNKKLHWAVKAKYAKAYKEACYNLTMMANLGTPQMIDGKLPIVVTFFPPDKRHRDCDNIVASLKNGQDGFAKALGVDDKHFLPTYQFTDEIKGWVKIQIPSA